MSNINPLTETQRKILEFIQQFYINNSVPPTTREICKGLGYKAPSTVNVHLKNLRAMGYLEFNGQKLKLSVPSDPSAPMVVPKIPIIGNVAAGYPSLATEEITGYLPYPVENINDYFALKIRGDSMNGIGILNGDYVVAKRNEDVKNGDIVIALIEDEATCKTFQKEGEKIFLVPHNPDFKSIDGTKCTILGLVKTVIRKL